MSHQDDSWLNGEPLGATIGRMRNYGTFLSDKDKYGQPKEPVYMTCVFWPDLASMVWVEIINAWSSKDSDDGAWNDYVIIRSDDGFSQITLGPAQLAGFRSKGHWKYRRETPEERKTALDAGFAEFKKLHFAAKTL